MNIQEKRYKLFGKTICKIIDRQYYKSVTFLHIFKILRFKYKKISIRQFRKQLTLCKKNLLYIDHMLGGGTEIYSNGKLKELARDNNVVLLQYDANIDRYVFYNYKEKTCVFYKDIKKLDMFSHIIVNNIVGYKNHFDLLNVIAQQKSQNTKIDFMLHDFYCICPCVHLFKPNFTTCVENNYVKCINCKNNIKEWQNKWKKFLEKTVDNIIVFSESSKKILLSVYPGLQEKIHIIPHTVSWVRKVNIKKHKDINIGVVGNISLIKGAKIVYKMIGSLPENVNIVLIGGFCLDKPKIPQFIYTGEYSLDSLPDIIEKHQIDIAFIPSIVPETFSFTTAECMNMGLPVACFNIGAPAERVSRYEKGLIISKIDAETAIKEILDFIKRENT